MDAKTLKAALAAALRVTVSTSLIGCGGQTSTDGGSAYSPDDTQPAATSRPDNDYPAHAEQPAGSSASERAYPTPVATGGASGAVAGSAVSAAGASETGEGGASTKPPTGCEAMAACVSKLEGLSFEFGVPLPNDAAECCQTVIEGLDWSAEAAVCDRETQGALDLRFMSSGARGACCSDPETWQHQACTPWGPAVPPELPIEALSAWELAA